MSLLGGKAGKGYCRDLPAGQVSHSYNKQCGPGQTYVHAQKKVYKATKKALKKIHNNIYSNVRASAIGQTCPTEGIANVMNECMIRYIDPVREKILKNEHMGIESFPSAKTLNMIKQATAEGTRCVTSVLRNCSGINKEEVRQMVDQYIQTQFNVPSQVPAFDQEVLGEKLAKRNFMEDFVGQYRSGLRTSPDYTMSFSGIL